MKFYKVRTICEATQTKREMKAFNRLYASLNGFQKLFFKSEVIDEVKAQKRLLESIIETANDTHETEENRSNATLSLAAAITGKLATLKETEVLFAIINTKAAVQVLEGGHETADILGLKVFKQHRIETGIQVQLAFSLEDFCVYGVFVKDEKIALYNLGKSDVIQREISKVVANDYALISKVKAEMEAKLTAYTTLKEQKVYDTQKLGQFLVESGFQFDTTLPLAPYFKNHRLVDETVFLDHLMREMKVRTPMHRQRPSS